MAGLKKLSLGIAGLIGFLYLDANFSSCRISQSKQDEYNFQENHYNPQISQNQISKNLEDSIKTENQDYDYIDTIKSGDNLKNFDNWISSVIPNSERLKKDIPNYLQDSSYKFSENDLKKFNGWIDSTLNESKRQNKNAILINKSDYSLYLIKSGKVYSKYPIELGRNPFDAKQREGDLCTPEGLYEVAIKKDENQSVFHRAFLLNYPNANDIKNKKTGSAVEVHGSGSGNPGNNDGSNWTLGCIALSNEDIDEIFPYINKKDRITVVRYTNIDLDEKLLEFRTSKNH